MKNIRGVVLLLLLGVLNFFFFRESLIWFYKMLLGLHDLFNTVLFFLISFFILKNTTVKKEQFSFNYSLLPLVICCLAVIGYYLSENFLQINILSFIFFLIYLFGLLGFFLSKRKWEKYIIPLCLLIMVLPFGNILDIYVGFPLRIVSVNLVSVFLSFFDIHHLSIDTIITIENNSSQVDFSCSGIKGLWAAFIFYFTNTWLKKYKINTKWFLIGIILTILILFLNTIRILILVYFDLVLELPVVSNIIHVPLGIFGFTFSCTIAYFLCAYFLESKLLDTSFEQEVIPSYEFNKLLIILPLLQIVLFANINEQVLSISTTNKNYFDAKFIEDWGISKLDLSNEESAFTELNGGELDKFSFVAKRIKGTGFTLKSNSWRSHHNPEYCITASGRKITISETVKMDNTTTIKKIHLNNGQQGYYWFQHKNQTTDDFGTRIWNEVFHQKKDWFLVCVVFDSDENIHIKKEFINKIKSQIKD